MPFFFIVYHLVKYPSFIIESHIRGVLSSCLLRGQLSRVSSPSELIRFSSPHNFFLCFSLSIGIVFFLCTFHVLYKLGILEISVSLFYNDDWGLNLHITLNFLTRLTLVVSVSFVLKMIDLYLKFWTENINMTCLFNKSLI